MFAVLINGVRQIPGIDYITTPESVSFASPPPRSSSITITELMHGTGPGSIWHMFEGDGARYCFILNPDDSKDREIRSLLADAMTLRDNPTVADMLERLRVVVTLVKTDAQTS